MFIFPTHHSDLTVSRFPFATVALIGINLLVFLIALAFADTDENAVETARARVAEFHAGHDYLEISDDFVATMDELDRKLYAAKGGWLRWYADNPDAAVARVEKTIANHTPEEVYADERAALASLKKTTGDNVLKDETSGALQRLENAFLLRASLVEDDAWQQDQEQLDRLLDDWRTSTGSSVEHRLGYVPARPTLLGLLAHSFVNTSPIQLVLSMIILWIAGAKLEDIWSWHVLVACYVVFGVTSALFHGLLASDTVTPVMGSTGAVAGLMGAFTVRLTRTHIRFAYFFWITLKPRYGTFEAPSFLVIPLWLLTEGLLWVFVRSGSFQIWPYLGGLIAGALCALIFRVTDFERKVLKKEPVVEQPQEAHPLVAFQKPAAVPAPVDQPLIPLDEGRVAPSPVGTRLDVREWTVSALDDSTLSCKGRGIELMILDDTSVTAVAPARIDSPAGPLAGEWFTSGQPPRNHAVLVAIIYGLEDRSGRVCLIDAGKLKYSTFMPTVHPTPRANFFDFLSRLHAALPSAGLVGPDEMISKENLPVYANLEDFLSSLRNCIMERQALR